MLWIQIASMTMKITFNMLNTAPKRALWTVALTGMP